MGTEPQLKHVCMLTKEGIFPVMAEEVVEKYPGISGNIKSKNFICELCGKYVILVNGKNRRPFFKHNRGDEDKECPERAEGMPGYQDFLKGIYMPCVRGIFFDNRVEFKIGINYNAIKTAGNIKNIIITVNGDKTYSYDVLERMNADGLSYLDIGTRYIKEIRIDIQKNEDNECICWLNSSLLMNDRGALFIHESGKFIIYDSNIFVGMKYDYLGREAISSKKGLEILKEECIYIGKNKYYHQIINIRNLTIDLIRFFKVELNYRLNNAIASYVTIWPEHVNYDNESIVNGKQLFTIVYGNSKIIYKRNGSSIARVCNFIELPNESNYRFGELFCSNYKSLMTIGRIKALEYAYFCHDEILENLNYPYLEIKDEDGNEISEGENKKLPPNKCIIINSDYKYMVIIIRNGWIKDKRKYEGRKRIYIDYGDVIEVYQGLDLRFRIEYRKDKKNYSDTKLYNMISKQRGKIVDIDVGMYEVGKYFLHDKQVYTWLQKRYRLGTVPEGARQLLIKEIKKRSRREI